MSYENPGHESDPSVPRDPSVQEQEKRLGLIMATNHERMLANQELLDKLISQHEARFLGGSQPVIDSGITLVVSRNGYGKRLEDGSWQNGEAIQVGFKRFGSDAGSATSFVHITDRIDTRVGLQLVPNKAFNHEEVEMVVDMVDELMLAMVSGQIPDLHEFSLDRIYIPKPLPEDPWI